MDPIFLTIVEILEIHEDQIKRYGGSPGIRDAGLLESALTMPSSFFDGRYLHADLFEMAAAYLFHIAKNHPFVDGNKRVGAVAALVFLAMNDVEITADEESLYQAVMAVAESRWDKPAIAAFFRENSRP